MKIMERTYICANGVREKTRYSVPDRARPRGKRTKGKTSQRKQEQNFNMALRRAARILNCNFTPEDGLLLTLDFNQSGMQKILQKAETGTEIPAVPAPMLKKQGTHPQTEELFAADRALHKPEPDMEQASEAVREAAKHEIMLYLRRLKRKSPEVGRYFGVVSDLDGQTGELVRVHGHLVLQAGGTSWDLLRGLWTLGSVDIRPLRQQLDYTPVAVYLLRQVQRQPDERKYFCSRGMEQPKTEEREVIGRAKIRVQPGATVLEDYFDAESVCQYVRYVPRAAAQKHGGHKRE